MFGLSHSVAGQHHSMASNCHRLGVAVLLALWLAGCQDQPAPTAEQKFDEAWADTMKPLVLTSKVVENEWRPKMITTETVIPELVAAPEANEQVRIKPVHRFVSKPRKKEAHDICRGKGKRWYNNHKTWRCKR